MPFAEALERAGSFEALLPHLREGRILARYHGLYTWPERRGGERAWRHPSGLVG